MTSNRPSAQRGLSLIGLLIIACVVAFFGLIALRAVPTVSEYMTIKKIVKRAVESSNTVSEVKYHFQMGSAADFVSSITAEDLEITKSGTRIIVSFAYDKEIPIVHPVYLLIKYRGSTADN